jgi:hypothetical protein
MPAMTSLVGRYVRGETVGIEYFTKFSCSITYITSSDPAERGFIDKLIHPTIADPISDHFIGADYYVSFKNVKEDQMVESFLRSHINKV